MAYGVVYAIIPEHQPYIKIGRSSQIKVRQSALARIIPRPFDVVNSGWCGSNEPLLHSFLHNFRLKTPSECFLKSPLVLAVVDLMRQGVSGFDLLPSLMSIDELEFWLLRRDAAEYQRRKWGIATI